MPLNGVTTTSTPVHTTDAEFRAWGSHMSTQFLAGGWVQTADTGQINWTTVLRPTVVNTAQGYEIWRLNDSLHSTAPIFMKWEWGGGNPATVPAIWITFGTGSNGAGTLTGPISTRQIHSSSAYATNPLNNYWSMSPAHLALSMWAGGTGASGAIAMMFCIERTKDSTGADTAQGLLIAWKPLSGSGSTAFQSLFWDRVIGTVYSSTRLHTLMPLGTTMKNGTQIGVAPVFLWNGPALNPMTGLLGYANADILALGAVTFQMYGASRVYMPIGGSVFPGTSINSELTSPTLMTRYD